MATFPQTLLSKPFVLESQLSSPRQNIITLCEGNRFFPAKRLWSVRVVWFAFEVQYLLSVSSSGLGLQTGSLPSYQLLDSLTQPREHFAVSAFPDERKI